MDNFDYSDFLAFKAVFDNEESDPSGDSPPEENRLLDYYLINRAMKDVEYPETLHSSLMGAIEAEKAAQKRRSFGKRILSFASVAAVFLFAIGIFNGNFFGGDKSAQVATFGLPGSPRIEDAAGAESKETADLAPATTTPAAFFAKDGAYIEVLDGSHLSFDFASLPSENYMGYYYAAGNSSVAGVDPALYTPVILGESALLLEVEVENIDIVQQSLEDIGFSIYENLSGTPAADVNAQKYAVVAVLNK